MLLVKQLALSFLSFIFQNQSLKTVVKASDCSLYLRVAVWQCFVAAYQTFSITLHGARRLPVFPSARLFKADLYYLPFDICVGPAG